MDKKAAPQKKPPTQWYQRSWLWIALAYATEIAHAHQYVWRPQFWGEEGKVFFREAYEGGLQPIFSTCQGYIHVYPRFVSFVSTLFPIRFAPHISILGALLGQATLFFALWSPRLKMPTWARALCSMAVVLVPQGGEMLVSLTNIQWFLGPALVLVLMRDPPATREDLLKDLLLIAFLGSTGPFVVLFIVPTLLIRLVSRRKFPRMELARWTGAFFMAACNFSTWDMTARPNETRPTNLDWHAWAAAFGQAVLPFFLSAMPPRMLMGIPTGWLALAVVIFAATLWLCFPRRESLRDPLRWTLLATGCIPWAAGIWECRYMPQLPYPYANGQRYFFILYVMIAWLLALSIADRGVPKLQRGLAACALACSLVFSLQNFGRIIPHMDYDYPTQAKDFEKSGRLEFKHPPDWSFYIQRSRFWMGEDSR